MKTAFLCSLLLITTIVVNAQTPNLDFENWTSSTHTVPNGWFTNNIYVPFSSISVLQVTGAANSGIRLVVQNATASVPGFVANTSAVNILSGQGGDSLSSALGIPTHLTGVCRYDLNSGDSARIYVVLKKNGTVLTRDSFFVKGTKTAYTSFSFPLSSMSVAPDSIVFAASAGSSSWAGGSRLGDYLELDELQLGSNTGTYPVPHGDFDTWPSVTEEIPTNWFTVGNVVKTTDKYSGTYAIKLTTALEGGQLQRGTLISMEIMLGSYTDTLEGYYKFIPGNSSDQGQITSAMWDGNPNTIPETITYTFDSTSTYTYFSVPLVNSISATSLFLNVYSSGNSAAAVGSTLYLDKLSIKKGKNTGVEDINVADKTKVYPNPAKDVLQLLLSNRNEASIIITDMMGATVLQTKSTGQQQLSIPLNHLHSGMYIYKIQQGTIISKGKFLKE